MLNRLKNSKMALKMRKSSLFDRKTPEMKEIVIFFLIFLLLGTIEKNAAICRPICGHIKTQCILSFQMVPEPGSYQLALLRYKEKLNRALMKFLLKISFLIEFSKK